MDKYLDKVRKAEEVIAGEIVEEHLAEFSHQETMEAALWLGRAQAVDRISVALSSQVIRFLEMFEKTKAYRALGYNNFVAFLNNSGLHEVTKNRYYDRIKLLNKEGDPVFDALTIAGVPITVRGYLEPGDVTIEGESIVVKGDDDSSDIVIHKDDHQSIVTALRNQAQIRRTAAKELAKVKDELADVKARHDAEKRELYDENDRLRASRSAEVGGDTHSMALAAVIGAFKNLRDEVAGLSEIDRGARKDSVLEILAGQMQLTAEAYGSADWARHAPRPERAPTGDDEADYVEDLLDRVLDGEVVDPEENERELAAAMS